ncbi:MAG: lactate permease LctP family transporter [Deltaproteobacteria bacterium]|nr:lactate permease LctP family transporter [Deltaproteobacteria bacterium]
MTWNIVTDPLKSLPLSAFMAAIPIMYLFWALAWKRMKGHWAAISAVSIAVIISIVGYGMPAKLALLATFNGMLFGLWPVAWIVVTAVFMYNLSVRTGQFEIIKNSLASITDDRRMQALLIAFSFGAFIEGAAGFGTPVAITAAMLVGLGFNPLYAAGLCLLANTAPVAYGAIGIPIIVAGSVSGIDQMAISQLVGRTLPFLSVIIPLYVVILMSGWKKGWEVWPAALVSGGSFAVSQFLVSNYVGPMLPDIISALVSIVCLTVFLRYWHPKQSWRFADECAGTGCEKLRFTGGQVFRAWAPFLILSIMVAAWGVKPIKEILDQYTTFKFSISGLDNLVIRGGKPMAAVFSWNLFSAAGTAILLAGIFSVPLMGGGAALAANVFGQTIKTLRWPIVSISSILGFAYIMNFSGMATTLGNAFAATGHFFVFFSPFLGWLGVFMTGSDTSSNALFGKLQEVTANSIGVDPVITVSANTSGGVCGKMISPQSLSVATAAVGLVGKESDIFRFTLKHSIILTTVIAILANIQAYLLPWIIPAYSKQAAVVTAAAAKAAGSGGVTALIITVALVLVVMAIALAKGRTAIQTT